MLEELDSGVLDLISQLFKIPLLFTKNTWASSSGLSGALNDTSGVRSSSLGGVATASVACTVGGIDTSIAGVGILTALIGGVEITIVGVGIENASVNVFASSI
jgi:hypothetical protein